MKTVIGLFTALLMTAGLLAIAPAASAAPCSNSYTGCVKTKTKASAPKKVAKGSRASVCGTVTVKASNATPRGELRFSVTRKRGKGGFSRIVPYDGGKVCVVTRKLKRTGRYTVDVAYVPIRGSVFEPSEDSARFKVKR
jgi:hypothetical protein